MSEPTGRARDRKEHGEHVNRESHRLVDKSGVKVDVRVQLAVDEVGVLQGNFFEFERNVKKGIFPGHIKYVISRLLDDLCARIVVLINPVTKAHQAAFAILHRLNEGGNVFD